MSLAFNLNDWAMRDLRQLPELKDKKLIGRGMFSAVFEGSRPDTVLKMTVDSVGYWLLNCCAAGVSGDHFPRVIKNHHDIGVVDVGKTEFPVYLFEMERLVKLKVGSATRKLARKISTSQLKISRASWSSDVTGQLGELANVAKLPETLRQAIRDVESFASNYPNAQLDMHMGNFMQRENGDLVITDPLFDVEVFNVSNRSHWQRRFSC